MKIKMESRITRAVPEQLEKFYNTKGEFTEQRNLSVEKWNEHSNINSFMILESKYRSLCTSTLDFTIWTFSMIFLIKDNEDKTEVREW